MTFKNDLKSGNKIIKAIRIKSELWDKFLKALEKYNSQNIVEMDINNFHRIAIAYLSEKVLAGEFEMTQNVS